MQATGSRRPSVTESSRPHSRPSSLPRPSIATNLDPHAYPSKANPFSPQATTPDAHDYYRQLPLPRPPHPTANGASRSFDRPSQRSASGPALNSAKSQPAFPANRLQKTSIKDLVARFNQASEADNDVFLAGRAKTPEDNRYKASAATPKPSPATAVQSQPASHFSARAREDHPHPADLHSAGSFGTPTQREVRNVSQSSSFPGPSVTDPQSTPRQPLFGEVISSTSDSTHAGYGIPREQRRGSDGSMHHPNPMFPPHSRSKSDLETTPPATSNWWLTESYLNNLAAAVPHHRSHSDQTGLPTLESQPDLGVLQNFHSGSGPSRSARTSPTQSRIPIKTSRPGTSSGSPSQPLPQTSTRQPVTPPALLSSRRYDATFGKVPGSSQRLKAIITAPVPKKSPPLRSSRPRQNISDSTRTNDHPATSPNRGRGDPFTTGSFPERKHLIDVEGMDFASRRDSIRRAVKKSSDQTLQIEQPFMSTHLEEDVSLDSQQSQVGAQDSSSHFSSVTYPRQGPKLQINIQDINRVPSEELLTATTEFEDNSPVVEMPGSFPAFSPAQSPGNELGPAGKTGPPHGFTSGVDSTTSQSSILTQIMQMRDDGSSQASVTAPSDVRNPESHDGETIQIMLGDTPMTTSEAPDWPKIDQSRLQPDAVLGNGFGSNHTAGSASPVAWTFDPTKSNRLTLDSDSYSMINRVLDQYRESGIISPRMLHDFQQYMVENNPELSSRGDLDETAKLALEELIREHSHLGPISRSGLSSPSGGSFSSRRREKRNSDSPNLEADTSTAPTTEADARSSWNEDVGLKPLEEVNKHEFISHARNFSHESHTPHATHRSISSAENVDHDIRPPTPPEKDAPFASSRELLTDPEYLSDLTPTPTKQALAGRLVLPEIKPLGTSLELGNGDSLPSTNLFTTGSPVGLDHQASSSPISKPRQPPYLSQTQILTEKRHAMPDQPVAPNTVAQEVATVSTSRTITNQTEVSNNDDNTSSIGMEATQEQRRFTKRKHLIKELVDTEHSYNQDMKVVEDIYMGTASAVDAMTSDDRRILFGNSVEIVKFSENFLDALKHAVSSIYVMPRNNRWRVKRGSFSTSHSVQTDQSSTGPEVSEEDQDRKTSIGETFCQYMTQMEKVYGDYLKNHDYANQRLAKLQQIHQVSVWLNECHTYANDITSAWDLDSLLVKPVQRILKYPLLLKSLIEVTPQSHPDFQALESANKEMLEISQRINESKKRVELLEQVVNRKGKDFDVTLGLSKAFGRRTEKLRQQVGLSDAVEDPEYKAIAEKFGGYLFQLTVVMRDVQMYKDNVENFLNQFVKYMEAFEGIIDVGPSTSPELESKWRKFATIVREITTVAYADHEAAVRKTCLEPLNTAIKLHEGPQRLMAKRKKRLVEYAKYKTMKDRGDKPDKKTTEQGEQFIALNETLKDELPKLHALTKKLVQAGLRNYISIQAQWYMTWQRKISSVIEEEQIPRRLSDVVDAFHRDFSYTEANIHALGICNGSLLADSTSFLASPSSSLIDDSTRRPTTVGSSRRTTATSLNSEQPVASAPVAPYQPFQTSNEHSFYGSGTNHMQSSQVQTRYRANSGNPPWTQSPSTTRSVLANPNQYYTRDAGIASPQRLSAESSQQQQNVLQQRPMSSQTFYSVTTSAPQQSSTTHFQQQGTTPTPPTRYSTVFSSAMPMSDAPTDTQEAPDDQATVGQSEYNVLFLAASLFEFNIDRARKEAGYPYLTYVQGEVFDVIAEKGELWLAKNQDDETNTIGWIWEKHFAKLMSGQGRM